MTNQELFTVAYLGILAQGGPGYSTSSGCKFRSENGRKCAIGQVIPDELYDHRWDDTFMNTSATLIKICNILNLDRHFAAAIQSVHDDCAAATHGNDQRFLELFRARMGELASMYGLDVPSK